MQKFGEILSSQRKKKRISIERASRDLVINKNHLEALENEDWVNLPEPPYVKGYIKTYSEYLKLDSNYVMALYRREFDEKKFPKKPIHKRERRFFLTPNRLLNFIFTIAIVIFISYITAQYSSIFSSPKLEISSPKDDETTSAPAIQISGVTEKGATVSVDGQFAPVDDQGNFSYEYVLGEGRNEIEIIAAFRLAPKNKITRTVRLIR